MKEEQWKKEEEEAWPSDSKIETALEWLDLKDGGEAGDGAFAPNSQRPNARGGLHTRAQTSMLQPLSNRSQRLSTRIRTSPFGGEEVKGEA